MSIAVYNQIGKTYDTTRQADPEIVSRLIQHLKPSKSGQYLDVGCGSGNYTQAIFNEGFLVSGVDISEEMLEKAKKKNNNIEWFLGDARKLPFPDSTFDGATCVLATHHIKDIETAFKEIFRVMKSGNFVIFTSFPEQEETSWLKEYFPNLMKRACEVMTNFEILSELLVKAGFSKIKSDPFFITTNSKISFCIAVNIVLRSIWIKKCVREFRHLHWKKDRKK